MHHSPHRDELVQVLVADDRAIQADLAAEFDRRRAEQSEQRAGRGTEPARPTARAGTSAALVAELLTLAKQTARLVKRFPHLVQLDVTQQADAAVTLDDLDVFMKWARQVTAIRAVGVPAQRQTPHQAPHQAPRQAQRQAQRRGRRESVTT
ncbi:hypothetical protein [Nonomuraea solani]|uniref:hypothetical protein n=1 Tax=Nonomuraea solani TaxID=1144553 RepID=UPI0011B0429C|nr:hypothetical protein [Nonomuraea solani]